MAQADLQIPGQEASTAAAQQPQVIVLQQPRAATAPPTARTPRVDCPKSQMQRFAEFKKLLDRIHGGEMDLQVECIRRLPHFQMLGEVPATSWEILHTHMVDIFGNGKYHMTVRDPHKTVGSNILCECDIDISGANSINAVGGTVNPDAADDVRAIKTKVLEAKAQKELVEAKRELERVQNDGKKIEEDEMPAVEKMFQGLIELQKLQADRDERARKDREEREEKREREREERETKLAAEREEREERRTKEMRELQERQDVRAQQMVQALSTRLSSAPTQVSSADQWAPVIKAFQPAIEALIASKMQGDGNGRSHKEPAEIALQLLQATQAEKKEERTVQQQMFDKLLSRIMDQKLNQPDAGEIAATAREEAKQEMQWLFDRLEQARGNNSGGSDDDFNIDPNHLFRDTIAEGFKMLLRGLKQGVPAIVEYLQAQTGKPAQTLTAQDVAAIALQTPAATMNNLAALPAPRPQTPQPQAVPVAQNPPRVAPQQQPPRTANIVPFTSILQVPPSIVLPSVEQPPQPASDAPSVGSPAVAQIAPPPQGVDVANPSVAGLVPENGGALELPAVTTNEKEADTRYIMDDTVQTIVMDLAQHRAEPEWVDFAMGKWPADFKKKFLEAEPHEGPEAFTPRLKLMKELSSPEVWAGLERMGATNDYYVLRCNIAALLDLMKFVNSAQPPQGAAPLGT